MRLKRTLSASVFLLLAAACWTQAGPLQVQQVPDGAQWVIHIDADAARSSEVVEAFWNECVGQPMQKGAAKWLRQQWGFSPKKELHGLTLYGTRIGAQRPVAIVHAKLDKQKIIRKFKQLSNPRTSKYKGHTIFSWQPAEAKHQHRAAVAFFKANLAVVAADTKSVRSALDVLAGARSSLNEKSPLADDTLPGSVIVARFVNLHQADLPCQVLDALQRFSYAGGEHEGRWTERMVVAARSKESAEATKQCLEGFIGLMKLHFQQDPKALALLNQAKVDQEGQVVTVKFDTAVHPLIEAAPAFCDAVARHYSLLAAGRTKRSYHTSRDDMATKAKHASLKGLRVAILTGEGFHDQETLMPLAFLVNRGAEVTVVGPETGKVKAYNSDVHLIIKAAAGQVAAEQFDALVLPGGKAPAKIRKNRHVVELARKMFEAGKPVAAICHGPQVLVTADVIEDRTMTCYSEVADEIRSAGATYKDQALVRDQNLITSRLPKDIPEWLDAMEKQFAKNPEK